MFIQPRFFAQAMQALLVIGLGVLSQSVHAMSPKVIEQIDAIHDPIRVDVVANEPVAIHLIGDTGALVSLSLETSGLPFDISLEGEDGTHYRQLLAKGEGRKHVVFMMPDKPSYLAVSSPEAGFLAITQTSMIAAKDLHAPKRSYQSPRLRVLAEKLEQEGNTDAFWQDITKEGTPMVEPGNKGETLLTFLARGAEQNVKMLGGPANDIYALERLGKSDVWFRTVSVPAGTLFSYQLAKDVPDFDGPKRARRVAILAKAKADPLNLYPWPTKAPDAYNQSSTFRVGGGALEPWFEVVSKAQGALSHHRIASAQLENERDIWIYRSAGFDASDPDTPLLFVFDGEQFLRKGHLDRSIDALVAAGKIPPLAAVFVSSIDNVVRAKELPDNDAFAAFMAKDVLSLVHEELGFSPRAERTILSGSSFGGLGSTTIALKHPEAFGAVLSLSGSYWWSDEGAYSGANMVARRVATHEPAPVRFYLAAGLFETSRGDGFASILEPNRHLHDVLLAKGYSVIHQEFPTAHDMFAWREQLPQGLIALLGSVDANARVVGK